MRDIVADVEARPLDPSDDPRRRYAGGVSPDGDLYDPQGVVLTVVAEEVAGSDAVRILRTDAGVRIAWEGCGCGGSPECRMSWLSPGDVEILRLAGSEPEVLGRGRTPSWIDVWRGEDGRRVLFAHGDVGWGDALA
ncbi:hypothetical protein C8E83_1090 [Frondihabitans australicus]|uniref:Uncharacterized protein n=2 Tax=Frondihabitans australicus TaxID=386892 RepID=A0A495IDY4_9MICO|nr:hypothetical protein C8E83_1090 [Frondihabitans australicus]